jgi:predicted 2-oxoglutarate/Fe(II)-dependent dioxygenase YbiX
MKLKDYIICINDILDKDLCKNIIDSSEDLTFNKAGTTGRVFKNYRNCYRRQLDKKFDSEIYKAVEKILLKYSKIHPWFLQTGSTMEDTGYSYLLYIGSEKGEYKEHVDHVDLHPRVLSCSFILNDNYDGGNFSFFNGEYVIEKKLGSAVIFPSNFCFPHAVTPVTNGDRHAVVTWIH